MDRFDLIYPVMSSYKC